MALTFVNQVGAPAGLNQAAPSTFIPENFVRWSRDVLFDQAGYLRRRAPFEFFNLYKQATPPIETYPDVVGERVVSSVMTINPAGERVTGLVVTKKNDSSRVLLYNENFQAKYDGTAIISSAVLDVLPEDAIFDCKQASTGGMWLTFMSSYASAGALNKYYQYYWYGGYGKEQTEADVAFGTSGSGAKMTYTDTITGSFDSATLTPGMFVYVVKPGSDEEYFVGTVKSATDTTVKLMKNIFRFVNKTDLSAATTYREGLTIKFKNVRPYIHVHGRGLITRVNDQEVVSGNIGTEGEGHFKSAGIDGSWALYRSSDNAWLGDVSASVVPTNDTLTLDTTYATSSTDYPMKADEYILVQYAVVPSTYINGSNRTTVDFAGVFNATYAGYQWYGNAGTPETRNRIVFSAYHNAEAVDLSKDAADSIILPGMNEMRGMASSSAGLVVFLSNKTYIVRGNYRANFSLEELYPEGCLSSMSIVEHGGGVFWASKLGIMYFDGATVRNLTEDNLGVYYTDSIQTYSPETDRIYGFFHKNYLFMHYTNFNTAFNPLRYEPVYADGIETSPAIQGFDADDWDPDFTVDDFNVVNNVPLYWDPEYMYSSATANNKLSALWDNTYWGDEGSQYVWGPKYSEDMTFAIYLPTNAITTLSNCGFRGSAKIDSLTGLKAIMGANAVINGDVFARFIDVDSMLTTNTDYKLSQDEGVIEVPEKDNALLYAGPDFFLQTRSFAVGDPVLRKWFRQMFMNLYLIDGGMRVDLVDNEDNDRVNIQKKKPDVWATFEEKVYTWNDLEGFVWPRKLAPQRSSWNNVQALNFNWYQTADAAFERRKMKFSWRYPTLGFRLYQMNKYRPKSNQSTQRPHIVKIDSWNIGFKPMRQSRV